MSTPEIKIADRAISSRHRPYVIAEIGANHNGDMAVARETIAAAKEAGADAAKFQSWSEDSLISDAEYERNTSYAGDEHRHFGSLREMVRSYQLSREQHVELKEYCDAVDIHFLSSAFSRPEVDLLVDVESVGIKLASMDINYLDLISHAARSGLPLILSTGMAQMSEILTAVEAINAGPAPQLCVLHCVSQYPAPVESLNLRNITTMQEALGVPIGFSDHTVGTTAAATATTLGAAVIEKHFTLDKTLPGWDHHISADPPEMEDLTQTVADVFASLGSPQRTVSPEEMEKRLSFRRCAVLRSDLPRGTVISREMVTFKRPGTGIPPEAWATIEGRALTVDRLQGDELAVSDFQD